MELLNQSADTWEDPAFSRLLRMLFCFFGMDVLQPANLKGTVRHVKTITQLTDTLDDIKRNAAGLVSLHCPSDICATKDAENTLKYIFAMDFEYWRTCENYCLGLKAADMNDANDQCWANLLAFLHDAFAMVPFNKMRYQFLEQIILMTYQLATYVLDLLDISSDECRLGLVLSIDQELKQ